MADEDNTVSVGAAGAERRITNVAAGTATTNAVNVSQLTSAGFTLDAAGVVTNPAVTYTDTGLGTISLGGASGTTISNVADGVADSDAVNVSQLTTATADLAYFQADGLNNGTDDAEVTGTNAVAIGANTVADEDNTVSIGAAGAERRITNVAAGTATTNAANVGQLTSAGFTLDAAGAVTNPAVTYTDASRAQITLGGASGTTISNVAAGVATTDAVNVGQLTAVAGNLAYFQADGANDGTDGASVTAGSNAVAIGANSVASEADTVSVGDVGSERRIVNVAAGTITTNAANVGQLQSAGFTLDAAGAVTNPAVTYVDASRAQITLGGASGTTISNVAAGVAGNDAVNLTQLNDAIDDVVAEASPYYQATGPADGSDNAVATGTDSVAAGRLSQAVGANSTAVGAGSFAAGQDDTAVGGNARVEADQGTAVGANSSIAAGATGASAFGAGSSVTAANAVAIGANSVADRANAVSVGGAGSERQITNVAAGTAATDAVNVSQLEAVADTVGDALLWDAAADGGNGAFSASHQGSGPNKIVDVAAGAVNAGSNEAVNGSQLFAGNQSIATAFGGGAVVNPDGTVSAPAFIVGGNTYNNVGDALANLDGRVTNIEVGGGGGGSSPQFTANGTPPATSSGSNSTAAGSNAQATAANSVALGANSVADRTNTVSVGAAGSERQVANVAAGTADTDAVNVSQMRQQASNTLTAANSYTDERFNQVVQIPMQEINTLRNEVNEEFRTMDKRINRQGAMNAAMVHMASSAANIQTINRVAVGTGWSEGHNALSVGYQRSLKKNVSLSLGAAFSGSEQSAGAGIGIGW
ncbi:trimeric autotransporter adhesin [Luteimonas cucumeris]|uniref:Trimeric autotransporter adhesin n=1 Tax=Luteimonas cucumeris TaxID=985012 RepID=A0A562L7A8_9GAMM|nr:trimeric autotransporter adhesin [Luteimonas cucumeris]